MEKFGFTFKYVHDISIGNNNDDRSQCTNHKVGQFEKNFHISGSLENIV